jgi:hypothetical protein
MAREWSRWAGVMISRFSNPVVMTVPLPQMELYHGASPP